MRSPWLVTLAFLLLAAPLGIVLPTPETLHPTPPAWAQTTQDRKAEAERLNQIGIQQYGKGQFREALQTFQQVLVICREIKDRAGEGTTLNHIGLIYGNLGQYPKALEFYQQSLTIRREIGDRKGESAMLNNIGLIYDNLGRYSKALEFYQQSLVISQSVGDRSGEGTTLNNIGLIYGSLGQYQKALENYQQALIIRKEVGDHEGEGTTLNNMGGIYNNLGQYPRALEFYQQALAIFKEVGNRRGVGVTLNNIGGVYQSLGQYSRALESYQQALVIRREQGNRRGEGITLSNIGGIYQKLGQHTKALESYQQSFVILKAVGDLTGEGTALNNIGGVYSSIRQYSRALESYQQALAIRREVGDRPGEGVLLSNIGTIYQKLGQYTKALEFYQHALAIVKAVGDREGEGTTLNNIGFLLEAQKQPEMSIIFFKQSVSTYEAIRKELRKLPKEQQKSYTETVASTYRRLAEILLQQDRVLEAQQVLDLLKVQELENYLRNVRGDNQPTLTVLKPETEILKRYGELQKTAIEIGSELAQLKKAASQRTLTAAEEQRLQKLNALQQELNQQFNDFTKKPEILALVAQLQRDQEPVKLNQFDDLRWQLKQWGNAVLLYPLILDDRIELIITLPNTAPLRRTVYVKRSELNQTILDFRQALQDTTLNAKIPAEKLYNWLIKPLEADLKQVNAQTIIYAPDGQLRYIPLAALYDGQQWLVQRLRVNQITASSLTKFGSQPQPQLKILAGAFADAAITYSVTTSQRKFSFAGLPFAGREVEELQAAFPSTVKFVDKAFSLKTFQPRMNGFSVVHLATHAAFVSGEPKDSFILFGDGKPASLRDIENWDLENVDLVVLSACETGVGGLGNGEEILGLGYQFQNRGARATIASLWSVDDGGTQVLMTAFYAALQKGMTKAQALQEAQKALITGNYSTVGGQRSGIGVVSSGTGKPRSTMDDSLQHPYYWAPFILIGNGM